MSSSKTLIVWFAGLHVAYSSSVPSTNELAGKTLVKHYNFPNEIIYFNELSFNGSHFVYGLCSGNHHERYCKITLDNLHSLDKSLSCDVTIKSSNKDTKINVYVRVALLLSANRALVLSSEDQKIKLTNVNLHDCSTNDAVLTIDQGQSIYGIGLVTSENSYDVFFVNSKICQNRSCRITFDNDGQIVKDAAAWGEEFIDEYKYVAGVQTAARNLPGNRFILERNNRRLSYVFLANNDDDELLTIPVNYTSNIAVSTIGDYIGTCLINWIEPYVVQTLECKQFDFDGKLVKTELQVNTSSLASDKKQIHYMTRLNLPESFVLFTIQCPINYMGDCSGFESHFAYHIDGNGDVLKTIEIKDFQCQEDMMAHVPKTFKNIDGQTCVSFFCEKYSVSGDLSIGVRCFTDDEL